MTLGYKTKLAAMLVAVGISTTLVSAMNNQPSQTVKIDEPAVTVSQQDTPKVVEATETPTETVEKGEAQTEQAEVSVQAPATQPEPTVQPQQVEEPPVIPVNKYKVIGSETSSIQNAAYSNRTDYTCVFYMEDGQRLWITSTLKTRENYTCQFGAGSVMSPPQYISFRQD